MRHKEEPMDIIVRGGEKITSYKALRSLPKSEEFWIDRGKRPRIERIERVYFYKNSEVVGYCMFSRYGPYDDTNVQGERQRGHAIWVRGPFIELPQAVCFSLPGPWRWRYLDRVPHLLRILREPS